MTKKIQNQKTIIIAGPCMAESFELLDQAASFLLGELKNHAVDFYFKASFDKANRTSLGSYRGPGLETGLKWFSDLKHKYPSLKVLTDVHETIQVSQAATVCDGLQIPAFLCRQTDLVIEAAKTGRFINIKKGQFMSPTSMEHIAFKARECGLAQEKIALTERGVSFGYGDLIVDPRSFPLMAQSGHPIIFDITHSTQKPPHGKAGVSGGVRSMAPVLARAAAATGYLNGFFFEVHPYPSLAKSDSESQLSFAQASKLIPQLVDVLEISRKWQEIDHFFEV